MEKRWNLFVSAAAAISLFSNSPTVVYAMCHPTGFQCPTGYTLECDSMIGPDKNRDGKPDVTECCRCFPTPQDNSGSKPPGVGAPTDNGGDNGGGNWLLPAIVLGAAALAAVNHHIKQERDQDRGDEADDVQRLLRDGPQLPSGFNMSAFGIRGLIKGGWPIVVDYEQTMHGKVQLRIAIPGADIVTYRLDKFGLGRHVLRFSLPDFLGHKLKPAILGLTAMDDDEQKDTLQGFRILGVGIGPRAVGSVAVDQLEFAPGTVRVTRGDNAAYAFHSLSDFDNAALSSCMLPKAPMAFARAM